MPTALDIALQQLIQRGAPLPPQVAVAARRSIDRYAGAVGSDLIESATRLFFDGLREIVRPKTGDAKQQSLASVRADILARLNAFDTPEELGQVLNLDFKLDVATRVMNGAGRFISDQTDVDEYPAWELHRIYDREEPRGTKNPSEDWPSRWRAAAQQSGDTAALAVLEKENRMVALKSSGIWQALGEGAGGYEDTLGNPFAPFAFNSGFGTDGVPRVECIELGLLKADQQPQPSNFDFSQLISLPEAA